jgi:hypothetical protein
MTLALPIERPQIDAAQRLHRRLEQWQLGDGALASLAKQYPTFALLETLLKASAVNALYGTNVLAIHHVTVYLTTVLQRANRSSAGPELVESLAVPPPINGKTHRHHGFASKFAHFFISAERFPIMDSYVIKMMKLHLGSKRTCRDVQNPYVAFCANHSALKEELGFAITNQELDHYLWLAGLYQAFRKNRQARINKEARSLFERSDDATAADLSSLLPSVRRPTE